MFTGSRLCCYSHLIGDARSIPPLVCHIRLSLRGGHVNATGWEAFMETPKAANNLQVREIVPREKASRQRAEWT